MFAGTLVSINAGHLETRGFSATKPTIPFGQFNPDADGYRNTNLSARIARRYGVDHELGLTLVHSEGRTWFDSGARTDDVSDERLQAYSVYSRNRITASWESVFRVGEGRDDLTIRGAFPSAFDTRQPQAVWQNTMAVPLGTAIAGLEHLSQRLETNRAFARKSRDVTSYFAGYTGSYGPHGWQVNARRDDNEQYGGHSTGNLAYAYALTEALRLRLGAGNAFKAPTFNDLYFPGFSNPDLRPERSRNREAGLDWRAAAHSVTATYFDNRITDLIVFDSATSKPQNLSRARVDGAEIGYRYGAGALQAGARFTFQRPRNEDTGRLLQRRAREHGSANAGYTFAGWTLTGEVVGASARFDSANESPATRLHGYALVNVAVARDLGRGWTARLRWDNVANRNYEIAQHYETPGRNVFLQLSFSQRGG